MYLHLDCSWIGAVRHADHQWRAPLDPWRFLGIHSAVVIHWSSSLVKASAASNNACLFCFFFQAHWKTRSPWPSKTRLRRQGPAIPLRLSLRLTRTSQLMLMWRPCKAGLQLRMHRSSKKTRRLQLSRQSSNASLNPFIIAKLNLSRQRTRSRSVTCWLAVCRRSLPREAAPACVQWFLNAPTKLSAPNKRKTSTSCFAQARYLDSHPF